MTRYLLDGRALADPSAMRGIGTYLRGLLAAFHTLGASSDVGLLLEEGLSLPEDIAATGVTVHPARLRAWNRHLRPLFDPLQVRRALGVRPPALYHAVEYAQPLLSPVPVVATVHDLIPFVMPRDYPWMRRERSLPMLQLRTADALIAVSRSTADDLGRIAHVDPARVTVVPEGVTAHRPRSDDELALLRHQKRLPGRFLLAVGTFDPRKRIGLLAEVVRLVRLHHDVGLVVAGWQGNFAAAVGKALQGAGLTSQCRVLGHVTEEELGSLYQACECLVFTSAYEGFGLPPLEAMAAGTVAAVFENSSLREVVDEAALVIPDGDAAAMAGAVSRVLATPEERDRLVMKGRARAATFSWKSTAEATLRVYAQVLAR